MASVQPHYTHGDIRDDESILDDDVIEADDAIEADDPLHDTSDTAPLRGNIQPEASSSARGGGSNFSSNYLTSTIGGEDRRATQSTIDETVWETLSRDLRAVWEKMRQVLWPKYLIGGMLQRGGGGIGAAERGEATGFGGGLRNMVGRWPDADVVLQGGMSEGLRDWDLWGPLIFCLLLSMFLSMRAKDEQSSLVFSGVFSIVWIGEAVVTLQIKLLGGNISFFQSVCIIGYTLFPLVIASLLSAFGLPTIARIPVYLVLIAWSLAAGVSILGGSGVLRNRVGIALEVQDEDDDGGVSQSVSVDFYVVSIPDDFPFAISAGWRASGDRSDQQTELVRPSETTKHSVTRLRLFLRLRGFPNAALTFLIPSFPLRKRKKGRQKDLRYRYLSVPSVQPLSAPQCLIACLIASYLSVRARLTRLTPIQRVRYLLISSSVIGYTRLGSFALSLA
ncbi:hypothetical protein CBS76997_6042 [Aspergillus niger]|nr:hypothetical protein CBS13152_8679 [Aspergillus niger]KAI3042732.1 hypothetical protein CBS76997_6042 [Aspergillus niger]